jgi:hypothetical protein
LYTSQTKQLASQIKPDMRNPSLRRNSIEDADYKKVD